MISTWALLANWKKKNKEHKREGDNNGNLRAW